MMNEPDLDAPLLSVVIPAYRRRESVLLLLADLFRQRYRRFEVIVVEDCGGDGTYEAVMKLFPQVIILKNDKNSGPTVSRNRGIRAAKGEIVVGLDSDVTVPDPDLLERVAATFAELTEVVGLAFRILRPDGRSEDTPRWWHPVPIAAYADKRFHTSYFCGTAFAFRRDSVLAAGLFPEILYMYYEEVELSFRVLDLGGSIVHCPDLAVLHHASEIARRSDAQVFYEPRNQILVAAACFPAHHAFLYLVPRFFYRFSLAWRRGELPIFLRAMRSVADLLPKRLKERKPLRRQTLRRISDMRRGILA